MKHRTIRTWLAAPVFPDDDNKTRRAFLLNSTLLTCMVLALGLIAGNLAGGAVPAAVTGLDLALLVWCLVLRRWAYRGRVGLVSGALLASGLVGITLAVAMLGTIRTPTTAVYMLLVIVAGLLLGRGGMIVMAVLCSCALAGLMVAENAGLLPRPDYAVTITQWVTYTVLFAWVGSLTLSSLQSTRRALARAEQEIAERKQVEQALRHKEADLSALLENTVDWVWSVDTQYRLIIANASLRRNLIATLGRAIERGESMLSDGLPRDAVARWQGQYDRALRGESFTVEATTQFAPTPRYMEYRFTPIRVSDQIVGVTVAGRDITEYRQTEAALRQARDQLQAILDATPAAISWIGGDLRYRGINRYLAESLGRPDTAVAGEQIGFLGTSPELAYFARDFFLSELSEDVREVMTHNGDAPRSYLVVARKYHAGQAAVLVGVDITKRKQAEEALRENRAMLKQILDTIPQAVFWKDKASVYRGCNQAFARAVGLTDTEQVVGKTDFDLAWPRNEAEVYRADDAQVVASGIPKQHIVEPLQQADGTRMWINTFKLPLLDAQREVQGILGIYEDITERKRAEEALRQYTEQLRELTARLADVQEGERRLLAQELHDRVGQNLTALSINLNIVYGLLPAESAARIGPRLEDSLELVSETVEHIRDVMAELRPPVLDDYGLLAALRWYGQRFAQRTGLAIMTQGVDPTRRLPLATEMTLFRIAQEALTNAARHARARQVTITLEALDDGVRLTLADDGAGFDPERHAQPNGQRTMGLLTMTERAESIGGRLIIDAAPGCGTRVVAVVGKVL